MPLTSAHAVSIPGVIDAFATVLRDHGKFGFDRLLQPAIKAAEEGYVVAPRIAFDWKNQFEKLKGGTDTVRYLLPGGKPPVAGDVIRQAELGKTLARDRQGRPRRLLQGHDRGGHGRDPARDRRPAHARRFRRPHHETTTPIGTNYKGFDVWQCPPNGPGFTALDAQHPVAVRPDPVGRRSASSASISKRKAARVAYMIRECISAILGV